MARIPQRNELADIQISIKDVNDETRAIQKDLDTVKASMPSTKVIDELQGAVVRLSKTPTFLDPNDVFRASGPAHMHGYVPDPGVTPGSAKYLREDGSWQVPPGTSPGVLDHPSLTHRSDAHQHPASAVDNTPYSHIASTDVQAAINEIDDEKLARDGSQTMLGTLDMNSNPIVNIKNAAMNGGVGDAELSGVRKITMTGIGQIVNNKLLDMTVSTVAEGIITGPRTVHMAGDHVNDEAKIDGLERVVFNNEVTASSIEEVSRIEYNLGVTAGSSYTAAEGRSSWDTLEDTLVVYVASGAVIVAVAMGWAVKLAANGL